MIAHLAGFLSLVIGSQQQPVQWRLVEEWRVGGEVEGPHSFGDVRGMGVLPNGGIVVIDFKDQQVHFLDSRGRPVRTVGRKGGGPGEFQQANGLVVTSKGDVIVNDPANARFTQLSGNGDLIKTFRILNPWGWGYLWDAFINASGLVDEYVPLHQPGVQSSIPARRVWSADFTRTDTTTPPSCPETALQKPEDLVYTFQNAQGRSVMSIPYVSPQVSEIRGNDGMRWMGASPGYMSLVRIPPGQCDPQATIRLSGARVPIPGPVRDSAIAQVRKNAARYSAPDPDLSKIPRVFLPYEALYLDSGNQLWVERRADATTRRFEVYTPAGRLVASVASPVTFQAYRPLIITNDRVLGFLTDPDDLLYLTSFRIVRSQ